MPSDALQRPVDRLHAIGARRIGPGLQVGLVELHDVGAGGEEVAHLLVHRLGVGHGEALVVRVVGVLRLLGHGEGAGQGDLDGARRVGPEEAHVVHLDRTLAPDRPRDQRHRGGLARPVHRPAALPAIDAAKRRGEAIGIALAPDLAVADDVDARALLVPDRRQRRRLLRLLQVLGRNPPQLARAHAGRQPVHQVVAVHQPFRLRVAADDRGAQHGLAHGVRSGVGPRAAVAGAGDCR